jgi:hypothetical protein
MVISTKNLYYLVLESDITSRIRVLEGTTYRIRWAVVDIEFESVIEYYDFNCPTWLCYDLKYST